MKQSPANTFNVKRQSSKYSAVHKWMHYHFAKDNICENCGTTESTKYEWANLSGEYKRDISDWAELCVSCHRLIDGHAYKRIKTIRANKGLPEDPIHECLNCGLVHRYKAIEHKFCSKTCASKYNIRFILRSRGKFVKGATQ